nr:MAG TPA: hypothetical protein [Caudoviricetes sp.]
MLKMVDGTGIIGVDMICPLGVSTPQPPNYDRVELEGTGMLVLPNSLDAPLERLELGGKTEQLNTRGVNLWRSDSTVIVSGVKYVMLDNPIQTGTYTLSAIFSNDKSASESLFAFYNEQNQNIGGGTIKQGGRQSKTFTLTGKAVKVLFYASSGHDSSQGVTTTIKEIQLETGTTATPYEPYTGGKPSPSPEYPQEIKNSGKWNDEKQKYEVNVKITNAEQNWSKEQVLTLTSDRPITKWDRLVEQGGEIGWLYGSVIATIDETISLSLYPPNGFFFRVKNIDKKEKTGYCDKLYAKRMSNGEPFVLFGNGNNNGLYTLNTQEFYGKTASEIRAKLKEYPLNIIGKSETTEFVPLPQSEQDAIRALKTYYPTTVITVDGGEVDPDIKVTYRKEI